MLKSLLEVVDMETIKKLSGKTRKYERHLHVRNWFTQFLKVRSCVMTSLCSIVALATYRLIAETILL